MPDSSLPRWLRRFERRIVTRPEWGAPAVAFSRIRRKVRLIFAHHDVTNPPRWGRRKQKAHMHFLEDFHREKRGMRAVAYSFLIFPNGRVFEGRGWRAVGGHTAGGDGHDYNDESYAFCFAGNFETQKPTRKAIKAARKLWKLGVRRGHIREGFDLLGHRDVKATACPGRNLYSRLGEIGP